MSNFKYNLKYYRLNFFSVLIFVFGLSLYQIANATIYAPGATLEPDCAPGAPLCGVSTPALTNIGNSNLTLTSARTLTLDGFTITFGGTSFDVVIDDNGDISVGGGDISTPSSGLTLSANAGSAGTIQIGTGGAGSATPDLFTVDVKSTAGDPAGTNGSMYYNANTNKLRCFENGAWGDCIFQSNGSAQNLTLARIGSSTFSTLQDLQNVFHSAGWIAGGAITDAGGATIDVTGGNGLIRSSNVATATISYFDWAGMSGIAIPLDSVRYIGVEYNGGSPQVSVRTSDNWNLKTDFPIGAVFNEGGVLSIYSDLQAVGDHAANMVQREHETMPLSRDERNGGIILGEDGTRNVTLSAGAIWDRLNRYSIPAINTSISGNFTSYYRDGGSGFTKVTGLTQWPNNKFDDNSGTLSDVTASKFATLWFYVDTSGELIMIYGRDEYDTVSLADAEMEPDDLPDRVMVNAKLVGKIVFQEGAGVASEITSAFSMSSTSSINTNHANLTGLDFISSGHTGFANAIVGVNDNITSATALASITPVGALTITGGAASVWSTSAGALTVDSAAILNLGTVNATAVNLGKIGITTTNNGDLSIVGNYITPKGADYPTTGSQNNVNLGTGFLFRYTGVSSATFTGIAGGIDGRQIRIFNASSSNIVLNNEDLASSASNRILTANGGNATLNPNGVVSLQYDSGVSRWRTTALPVEEEALIQGGNAFGAALTFGTTDANVVNVITSGATRFSIASGGATLTGTGATSITTDNTLSLSSAAGSALSVTSGTTGALNLDSGSTGAVNIGNNANAKTITVGNIIGATAVNINTGTGGSAITTTNGTFALNTGTGAINLGTDAVAKTITLGNVTGATSLNLNAGSGGGIFKSSSGLTLNPFDVGAGQTSEIRFAELAANGSNYIGFKSPDLLGGNVVWTLPDADGNPGDMLATDGFNNLSWAAAGACVGCVVNSSKFNVDAPTGNITEINDITTSFPAVQGGSGDVLTNDGAGNLTWSPAGAGSTALSDVSAATGNATIGNGNNNINWNWVLSGATNGFNISETSASSGTGYLQRIATLATSTAKPFSLGARGTTIFDTTATGGLTLGDSATLNTPITLQSGTGAVNIGADAVTHTITLGNTTGATAVNINSGSGGINFGGNTSVTGSNTFSTGTGVTTINSTAVTLAGNSTVIDMTGTGTLGLNTTTNRAISTGTGLLTAGGALTANGTFTQGANYATPKGSDYTTTGTQDDVNLGIGSLFRYTGASTATFTGITGGVDGRIIRIINASASDLIIANQNIGSLAGNRFITASNSNVTVAPDVSVTVQYDSGVSRWRIVTLPVTALSGTVFLQSGNAFGATATLGTTDANALNIITGGATRFSVAAGAPTLTGTGSTSITSTGSTSLDSTTSLSLGTSTATSVSIGATGVTTTNNGPLTSTQTLTASNGLTLTTGALNLTATSGTLTLGSTVLAGVSPLVFDGATANANTTTFTITDPSGARTITFPDASITVNAAANISGTTLASNVVTSSLTATGALSSGSIASGFGSISTTNNITTSANVSTTGTGTMTSAGTLTASNGFTQTTGALSLTATSGALTLSGLSASSINTGANNLTFTSGNFNTTATGINSTAIGATTVSTGAFSTLSSTGATNLGTSGASNVTIATTGTGNVIIGNATGTFALASSGGLNVTTGGALTGVASIDTIATSATALTFAGAGTISSTTTSAITLDSGTTGLVNLGTGNNAKTISIGTGTAGNTINIGTNNTTADTIGIGSVLDTITFVGNSSSSLVLNGATVDATELNRLDGKDAALVDTNDAVATAITGTGALNAGSITSGFGTIDTGADNITTTGTVFGNDHDRSTAGALTFGNTNATSVSVCNSASCDTITIGTNADADTITIGDTLDAFSISSTGLNLTTGGALTGVTSLDTIATSATTLTFAGAGTISSTTTSAIALDSGTTGAVNIGTGANAKTITFGNVTGATSLNLKAGTGSILLSGQATGTSATFLGLPVKTDSGDPTTTQTNGAMYYNSNSNKFRCYENSAWKDCDTTGGSSVPSVNSFTDSTLAAAWTDADTGELWDDATRPNITPSASTSEIMVMVTVRGSVATSGGGDTNNPVARIDREIGSTADCADTNTVGPTIGDLYLESTVANVFEVSAIFVDTPTTTSNVSYTICSSADSGGITDTTTATRTEVTLFEVNDAADLAEVYSTNDNSIGMGDVVSLDSTLEFGVQKSSGANDKKVIGIVSSKPAMVIGGKGEDGSSAVPVALSGRVPVKVVTENGAIVPGDYLTTSSTPGVAMKSNGSGLVIGQAMSSYDGEGMGIVTVFVKNFDLGNMSEIPVLLGDISPVINSDGTDNGLATLISDIQAEITRDPVVVIGQKITDGKKFLTDFVSARVTSIRGYFDEVFAKKVHTEQICVKKSDGSEVCVGGDQLDALLNDANIDPEPTPEPAPETIPETTPEATPESTPESSPDPASEVAPEATTEVTPEATPEPAPEPESSTPAPEESSPAL